MDSKLDFMENKIEKILKDSIKLNTTILRNKSFNRNILQISNIIVNAIKNNNKVLFFGNGGSAADSQHMAGEFICRFMFERKSIPGIALTTDPSVMTSIANDYGYEEVFSRQVEALGNKGDISFAFSTSGMSRNVIKGLETAKKKGLITIGMTGENANEMGNHCDFLVNIPNNQVPRIQEGHLIIGHIICEIVEEQLFK
tara:strand:- start:49 stop:645 length:597 start_codon:yes stop_codon:yes gene_type:complete